MYSLIVDNEYISCAEKLIESAQGEIILSTFKIQYDHKHRGDNLRRVIDKLIEKAKAGVKILFLMNWEEKRRGVARTNETVADLFKGAGIDVRTIKESRCCHAKLLIIDGKKIILGSHNWSNSSWQRNFELSLFSDDENVARAFRDVFSRSFSEAKRWKG